MSWGDSGRLGKGCRRESRKIKKKDKKRNEVEERVGKGKRRRERGKMKERVGR